MEGPREVGGFSFFRGVEQPTGHSGAWERPKILTRLCALSFINQGVVFPLYLFGLLGVYMMQHMPAEEVQRLITDTWSRWMVPEQQEALRSYMDLMREHGKAVMGIFALRTLVRAFGTWRMWTGWRDGFHIYTSAQLLGILLPLWIAGPRTFNFLGFFIALNWCYLYFTQRKALRQRV
jgi:hypothetical protein